MGALVAAGASAPLVSWEVVAQSAALVFVVIVLGAAVATDQGRRGLAAVGIALAWLALRVAERAADSAVDLERGDRAARAARELRR